MIEPRKPIDSTCTALITAVILLLLACGLIYLARR